MSSRVGKVRHLLNAVDAAPITSAEFHAGGIGKLWKQNKKLHGSGVKPLKLGLCVSGGADSMCLAFLVKRLQEQNLSPPLDLKAFIIDHKARHDSTVEAHTVANFLGQIGIVSDILTMKWPDDVTPIALPSFESQARVKRYRLLAEAATRNGIHHLLLGHHQDDQIETVLMRLVRGKFGSLASFKGIADEVPIPVDPEINYDLLGPDSPALEEPLSGRFERLSRQCPVDDAGSPLHNPVLIESLAARISLTRRLDLSLHRPLLNFSKARVLATCKANKLPFISDPTNFNPQVTLRNAVRYLLTNYPLPRALSKGSILAMHSRAVSRLANVHSEVQRFLDIVQLTSLDLRSGSLALRIPKSPQLVQWNNRDTPVSVLAQILRLVSPIDDYEASRSGQQTAADIIFGNVFPCHDDQPTHASVTTFAANQVLMTRDYQEDHAEQQRFVFWRFARQPFTRKQINNLSQMFASRSSPEASPVAELWSNWIFWDRRYGIRICCTDVDYLQKCAVRPFQPSDAADLRKTLGHASREALANLLHDAAPGKVRYTLPVITDDVGVRALPTLDFAIPKHKGDGVENKRSDPRLISWEVKYKYIECKIIDQLTAYESPVKSPSSSS